MKKKRLLLAMTISFVVLALALTGCGGGAVSSARNAGSQNLEDRGPITYVAGKDNSGVVRPLIEKWNKAHPDEQVTFKELTDSADQQRDDMVKNLTAQNEDYDVLNVDVVWTAEFAARRWIVPLEGSLEVNQKGLLKPSIEGAKYDDKLMAMPFAANGGLLYYRTDLVDKAPKTWEDMMAQCDKAKSAGIQCYGGQLDKYEGLTVNVAEQINTEGGRFLNDDGQAAVKSKESVEGLTNLSKAVKDGNIPQDALSWKEEDSRTAFQEGNLMFLRNWPYIYAPMNEEDGSSNVNGKFAVAPLPGKDGKPGKSSLGGNNLAISSFSKNKGTAKEFIQWMAAKPQQKFIVDTSSDAPVVESLYDDKDLRKKYPYLPQLKASIETAVPRPITPHYQAVTNAIQDNSYAALKGEKDPEKAIDDMQSAIELSVKPKS